MEKFYILLCCGAGISSGLLSQQVRKAAKKRGLDVTVEARSESEVPEYYEYLDVLFLGPHCAAQKDEFAEQLRPYGKPVVVVPQGIYGKLDGGALLDLAIETIGRGKESSA